MLATEEQLIKEVKVGCELGNSDHRMVEFSINKLKPEIANNSYTPNFNKADLDGLKTAANLIDFKHIFGEKNANDCCKILTDKINDLCYKYVPNRKLDNNLSKQKPLWWNQEIGRAINIRNKLHGQRNPVNENLYVQASRDVKKIVKMSKK